MLNIYVCDDNETQLHNIVKYVSNAILIEEYDMTLALATNDPYEVLKESEVNHHTGIYFLDVDLQSDINGIQLAEKIRKHDPRGFIVFITTHSEMSHLTFKYKVEALDYIIKDDFDSVKSKVKDCLANIAQKYKPKSSKNMDILYIKSDDRILHVEFDKIILLETAPKVHKVILYAVDRQMEFYGRLKDIEKKLDDRFIRCHKSCIVNKHMIKEVNKRERIALLDSGLACMVSVRGMKLLTNLSQ